MAETKTVTITDVKLTEGISQKTNKPYTTLQLMDQDGVVYSGFKNARDIDVLSGDTIKLTFQPTEFKGQLKNNIVKMEYAVIGDKPAPVEVKTLESKPVNKTANTVQNTSNTTLKDVSMEVSGLLQAIIHSQGLDADTEEHLNTALQIKTRVALKRAKDLGIKV